MRKLAIAFLTVFLLSASHLSAQPYELFCHDQGYPVSDAQGFDVLYKINDTVQEYLACGGGTIIFQPQILMAVIEPSSCEPWLTPGTNPVIGNLIAQSNEFGQLNANGSCGRSRPEKLFYWEQPDPNSMTSLVNMIYNEVPDGHYILMYTWIVDPSNIYGYPAPGTFESWSSNTLNAFHSLGFTQIDTVPLDHPWIFLAQKGNPSSAVYTIGTHPEDSITLSANICGSGIGIREAAFKTFEAFPNPTTDFLTIESTEPSGKANYHIHSLTGQLIQSGNLHKRKTLDVCNWANGVYFIRVNTENEIWSGKFVKD